MTGRWLVVVRGVQRRSFSTRAGCSLSLVGLLTSCQGPPCQPLYRPIDAIPLRYEVVGADSVVPAGSSVELISDDRGSRMTIRWSDDEYEYEAEYASDNPLHVVYVPSYHRYLSEEFK
ncbi:MAG: hypothetical protein H6732_06285 [Alphaproteobacteria bacterium]|nr:hypothetical protein [Alphaproteobacteria bacterium]